MSKISDVILTAGPSITNKEIAYVADAVANGWNHSWANYLSKFQNQFAKYLDVSHALATSSCTGAMHLILKALNIKEGDEIIVPEITWVATASVVKYVGATPVFCDIDLESWTMLPESVEKLITPKTIAIMPVHLYGHPCDMEPLLALAKKHNLFVIEDAAQSIGATYHGKRTGSFGDAAAFSFQGAKAIVTGEGGMLVTNNKVLFEKAQYFGDHGRDPKVPLFNTSIGFKYKMSNMQAALGLAQLERVEEIVAQKKKIFKWYQSRLNDIELLKLNVEKKNVNNIFWMTSIILSNDIPETRDDFIQKLKEKGVDSRPVFHPLSSMPMFQRENNPNAYFVGSRGINLPSGHNLSEEEIDYVCGAIKQLVMKQASAQHALQGWMSHKEEVIKKIADIKENGYLIDFNCNGALFTLEAICQNDRLNDHKILFLMEWRKKNQHGFLDEFDVTVESTKRWLEHLLTKAKDRVLFFVREKNGEYVGHVGLNRFDWKNKACEIDNIVRGKINYHKGVMLFACEAMMSWGKIFLDIQQYYLKVLGNNSRAIDLYKKLNFKEISRQALYREIKEDGYLSWRPLYEPHYQMVENYFLVMKQSA